MQGAARIVGALLETQELLGLSFLSRSREKASEADDEKPLHQQEQTNQGHHGNSLPLAGSPLLHILTS